MLVAPTVAACVPTRNRSNYLAQSLQSILDQTRRPNRLIISDDASTDETRQVVAEYAARFRAASVEVATFRHDPPLGQEANRRFALQQGGCEYLAMLDDDDLWRPGFLARACAALDSSPECAFASASLDMVDSSGAVLMGATETFHRNSGRALLSEGPLSDWLELEARVGTFFLQATVFRLSTLESIGFIPEGTDIVCDCAVFVALGLQEQTVYFIPERLGAWRQHAGVRASSQDLALRMGRRQWMYRWLAQAQSADQVSALSRACIEAHRDYALDLMHGGMRLASLVETVSLVRRWGLRAGGVRVWVYLPLLFLGVGRLHRRRNQPRLRPDLFLRRPHTSR